MYPIPFLMKSCWNCEYMYLEILKKDEQIRVWSEFFFEIRMGEL